MNNIPYEADRRTGGVMVAATSLVCLALSTYELWVRHPAYHFFPLPLAALGWLVLQTRRHAGTSPLTPARKGLVWVYLALAVASFLLVSPFLAGISFVIAMMAYGSSLGGEGRSLVPAWSFPVLALFLVPPPLELDYDMHQLLAGLAAQLSQGWLDTVGVIHVVEGVIVATPEKRFFVDDACSGTNSLLVALCVAVVLASLKRRSLGHLTGLLMLSGLVSVVSNVLRICVIIGALHFWKIELDQGMRHELLGVAFFVLDLLLVCSADHAMHFFLNRPPPTSADSPVVAYRPGPMQMWHRRVSVIAAAIGLLLLAGPSMISIARSSDITAPQASLENFSMPVRLGNWVREGEKPLEDTVIGKLGVRNQVWLYRNNGMEAYVAVNFPFLGFHDTRLCYQGQGWQFQKQEDGRLPGDSENTVRFLHMHQPTELMHADLWLCVLDDAGVSQPFSSDENAMERMGGRLISRWNGKKSLSTTYVLQVLAIEPVAHDETQDSYIDLVAGARAGLAAAISNSSNSQGKESE